MKATLTQLARNTAEVVRPVMHGGKEVVITDRGRAVAKIIPVSTFADRKALLELIRQIGPLDLPLRK